MHPGEPATDAGLVRRLVAAQLPHLAGLPVVPVASSGTDNVLYRLGDDLVVRKLKFLDGAVDALENTERDSLHDELDARYALMSGELHRLFAVLETALKFSRAE